MAHTPDLGKTINLMVWEKWSIIMDLYIWEPTTMVYSTEWVRSLLERKILQSSTSASSGIITLSKKESATSSSMLFNSETLSKV